MLSLFQVVLLLVHITECNYLNVGPLCVNQFQHDFTQFLGIGQLPGWR